MPIGKLVEYYLGIEVRGNMNPNIANRDLVIQALIKELFGPSAEGIELDVTQQPVVFNKYEDAFGPFIEKGTGQEILQRDNPTKRYGVGVLHPFGTSDEEGQKGVDTLGMENGEERKDESVIPDSAIEEHYRKIDLVHDKFPKAPIDNNPDELDLSTANSYKPSSIGVSFLARFSTGSRLIIDATGGRYRKLDVEIETNQRTWWVRSEISLRSEFSGDEIINSLHKKVNPSSTTSSNLDGMDLRIELFARPYSENVKLITVCLINRTEEALTENILFQAHFKLSIVSPESDKNILPYPGPELGQLDDEEKSMALLYRHEHTFGVGHGCAAVWDYKTRTDETEWLSAECLPHLETPSITPDIRDETGNETKVPMATLAGLVDGDDGHTLLENLIASYELWIADRKTELLTLKEDVLRQTGEKHLQNCEYCAERMRRGLAYLRSNPLAYKAFQLANEAILLQQIHSRLDYRRITFDEKNKRLVYSVSYTKPDPKQVGAKQGFWRAFQIAFLLCTVESVASNDSPERETVELIWFPTGGGKTEAYLGLAAFSLLLRRLRDPSDDGVQVLMRYTLRLLTTQQFLRASRLICALEQIRKEEIHLLGSRPFTLGLWVGGSNTPNTRADALSVYKGLEKGDKYTVNKFVLDRCPWCGAQIGPIDDDQSRKSKVYLVGYYRLGNSIGYKCPDRDCEFSNGLPILVTDEEMYENPPSMIIGTVDKFAMLAWKPDARSLFGIDMDGLRVKSPPSLIIQDELHLISGPLGSMVGLYETLIEELCTDRRPKNPIKPKIICSTATIRRYQEQIKALYARGRTCLFPSPGIDVSDSFFSRYAKETDGSLAPGRIYIGVHAPGLGSMQTVQVRTFTTLLQSPMDVAELERDPWWTLLLFFNSLRELGTTLSLLQSDIPDYQQVCVNRIPSSRRKWRSFSEILELTGRASSEDVPRAISDLEKRYPGQNQQRPVDVCLASNILEVGIDIERLSLMAVVGQPKTTSQYIQVTGRVGRKWWERPGLIVTLYSASKPRDRSHFEKFVSYHQRLYAQVEPTSVTPFSAPVLDRALHAVMIGYVRQTGAGNVIQKPDPYPEKIIELLRQIIIPRIKAIDPDEVGTFENIFALRAKQWKLYRPIYWDGEPGNTDDIPLMKVAGSYFDQANCQLPLPTMQSMRSVDAECIAEIKLPTFDGESEDA